MNVRKENQKYSNMTILIKNVIFEGHLCLGIFSPRNSLVNFIMQRWVTHTCWVLTLINPCKWDCESIKSTHPKRTLAKIHSNINESKYPKYIIPYNGFS